LGTVQLYARWKSDALIELCRLASPPEDLLALDNRIVISWFIASIAGSLRLYVVSGESIRAVTEGLVQTYEASYLADIGKVGKCRILAIAFSRESARFNHQIAIIHGASEPRAFGTQGDKVYDWLIKRKRQQWAQFEFSPLLIPGTAPISQNRFVRCLGDCIRFPACFLRAGDDMLELAVDVASGWIGASADEKVVARAVQRYANLDGKAGAANGEERCLAAVSACYGFTAFVQEFVLALEAAERKDPRLFEVAITALFVRLPRGRRELMRPVLELILGIAIEEPWMSSKRNSILELFAVALGGDCLEQLGHESPVPAAKLRDWSKQQPSHKFDSPARDAITPREAIERMVKAAMAHVPRVEKAAERMNNPVELKFQAAFDSFVGQRILRLIQIHP
jgi:hypothetical protein